MLSSCLFGLSDCTSLYQPFLLISTRAYMRISIHSESSLDPGQVPEQLLMEAFEQNPLPSAISVAHDLSRFHTCAIRTSPL